MTGNDGPPYHMYSMCNCWLFREIRLLETMENVCDKMKSYVSRSRRKFPYVKGGIV